MIKTERNETKRNPRISSSLVGRGAQVFPTFETVHWERGYCTPSGDDIDDDDGARMTDCQPFEDTAEHPYGGVLTLGYAIT